MRAIFVSYRRSDTEGEAGRLSDLLMHRFSDQSVFMDVDSIAPGRDFRKAIDESIQACSVVLVLIGPGWLDAHDDRGNRRLDAPNDYVRLEISAALHRDIPVIPVLIRGAKMPHEEQLPKEISDLAFRNSVELTHARWRSDLQVLIEALESLMGHTANAQEVPSHTPAPLFAVAPPPTYPAASPGARPTHGYADASSSHSPLTPSQRRAAEPARLSGTSHHSSSVIHPYRPPTTHGTHSPSHVPQTHTAHVTPQPTVHTVPHAAGSPVGPSAISHAEVEKVSRQLAHFIGPIAEIVVKRAAKKASTTGEMIAAVSQEIESAADRDKFLRQCRP